jgi:chromosome segregation ATPase
MDFKPCRKRLLMSVLFLSLSLSALSADSATVDGSMEKTRERVRELTAISRQLVTELNALETLSIKQASERKVLEAELMQVADTLAQVSKDLEASKLSESQAKEALTGASNSLVALRADFQNFKENSARELAGERRRATAFKVSFFVGTPLALVGGFFLGFNAQSLLLKLANVF